MSATNNTQDKTAKLEHLRRSLKWWQDLRAEHAAKRQIIAVRKCTEEIDLLQQEINDAP